MGLGDATKQWGNIVVETSKILLLFVKLWWISTMHNNFYFHLFICFELLFFPFVTMRTTILRRVTFHKISVMEKIIWDYVLKPMENCVQSSIVCFYHFYTSINKVLIFGERLGTRLWSHEVLIFSWTFLIFLSPML